MREKKRKRRKYKRKAPSYRLPTNHDAFDIVARFRTKERFDDWVKMHEV